MKNDSVENMQQMDEPNRVASLAMDVATFRALGHRLVDRLAEGLDALQQGVPRDLGMQR